MTSKTIKVGYLARVEGEGSLYVKIRNGVVAEVSLNIFEPPRFFEGFLPGRAFTEAPDITARICGICPVAYQMSAVHAMERACGAHIDGQIRALRRLLYCGEWIESHALHIYLLHLPDFLGYADAVRLAKDHPTEVKRGLELKKVGNEIVSLLGGREIHPINVRVGGFYRAPEESELQALGPRLEWAREAALETVRLVAGLSFPDFERDYEFVSLRHEEEYPFNEGRIVSTGGLDIDVRDYESHFDEQQVQRSTALHSLMAGRTSYHVGPLARYNLNFDHLSPVAKNAAREAGLGQTCRNPYKSIIVRAVETVYACDEALRIIGQYSRPDEAFVDVRPQGGSWIGTGWAVTEAPRGSLYHRYEIDGQGLIRNAKIVPPTSQNQQTIEEDLFGVASANVHMEKAELTLLCEHTVRNYDPCISCSTHFLNLEIDRDV